MRLLLKLLPKAFRARHGREIEIAFREMKDDLGPSPSWLALLRLYVAMAVDVMKLWMAPSSLDILTADIRFAIRQFARTWATSATMLVILSVGMSVAILLFSFVHSYTNEPPRGIALADDLVRIRGSQLSDGEPVARAFSQDEMEAYQRLANGGGPFASVAGWSQAPVALDIPGSFYDVAPTAVGSFVSERYFDVLGVDPMIGPGFPMGPSSGVLTAPLGARTTQSPVEPTVVIGHGVWTDLFGSDPAVIGRVIEVNGVSLTVVGVSSPEFAGVGSLTRFKVWMPIALESEVAPTIAADESPYRAIARLGAGVSFESASSAVRAVAVQFDEAEGHEALGSPAAAHTAGVASEAVGAMPIDAQVVPLLSANGDPSFDRDVRRLQVAFGLLALIVLAVTCTNVSALLMSLAMARRHEIVVRLSLGAARGRVVRQMLTESTVLGVVGGAGALGIVWTVMRVVDRRAPVLPFSLHVTWPATLFALGMAISGGVLLGLAPSLHATRVTAASALRDGASSPSRSRLRAQRALVVAQVALTQPLVVGLVTVLLIVVGNFRPIEPTSAEDRIARISLSSDTDVGRVQDALLAMPEVEAVVPTDPSRELGAYTTHPDDRVASTDETIWIDAGPAAPGFFSLMEIPILRGREITAEEMDAFARGATGAEMPVIVSANLADRLWPGADPIGRRFGSAAPEETSTRFATLRVIGVFAEPSAETQRSGDRYDAYIPGDVTDVGSLLVRTRGPAQEALSSLRAVAQREVPGSATRVETLASMQEQSAQIFRRITAGVLGAGLLALLLAAIGLYAVIAFGVTQRSTELAVRMAIGAGAKRVAGSLMLDGLRLGVFGLACGLPLSLIGLAILKPIIEDQMRLVSISLPQVAGVVAVLVLLTAAAAAFVPARRAAGVDPARTLRG